MAKGWKILKTVGKIYGIVWLAECVFVAKGIVLGTYYDEVEDRCVDYELGLLEGSFNVRDAADCVGKGSKTAVQMALNGWKRQIKTTAEAVKQTLHKG